jgi:hypothetical protein
LRVGGCCARTPLNVSGATLWRRTMSSMRKRKPSRTRRTSRTWVVRAVILALVAGWFAAAELSGHQVSGPATHASPRPSSIHSEAAAPANPSVFPVAQVRWSGQTVGLRAVRGKADSVCIELINQRLSCDLQLGHRQLIKLAFANWLRLDASEHGLGVLILGSVGPRVQSVHVSLGPSRWSNAMIITAPAEFGAAVRLFVIERRTSLKSLNRSLPIVALDGSGRPIGRTSYLIQGG